MEELDPRYLEQAKAEALSKINLAINLKIVDGSGFEFPQGSGLFFSLSMEAQSKWIGLMVGKDFLTYPIRFKTKDDRFQIEVASALQIPSYYGTAMMTVAGYLDLGRETKNAIIAATTLEEINSLVFGYIG